MSGIGRIVQEFKDTGEVPKDRGARALLRKKGLVPKLHYHDSLAEALQAAGFDE